MCDIERLSVVAITVCRLLVYCAMKECSRVLDNFVFYIACVMLFQVPSSVSCREQETRVGATPPPSPSDRTHSAILTSRITQLSREVKTLRKRLAEVEAKSEGIYCVCMLEGEKLEWVLGV